VSRAKMAEPIKMSFGTWTQVSPRKQVLDGGAQWHNLANTIEPSMCGGDAAFLSNYLDQLLLFRYLLIMTINLIILVNKYRKTSLLEPSL